MRNKSLVNYAFVLGVLCLLSACSLKGLVDVDAPQIGSEVEHTYLESRQGALSLLYSTLGSLQAGVSKASFQVGTLTDELYSRPTNSTDYYYLGRTNNDSRVEIDVARGIKGLPFQAYDDLQAARVRAGYSRYFLRRHSDSSLNYAISAAYAYEGYAIVILAENLCSGVPLSDAQYGKKIVYGEALSTDSLFKVAAAKFDSALAIDHDSARFIVLAKAGKARALLSLGLYRDAYKLVSGFQPNDLYLLHYTDAATPIPNSISTAANDAFWTSPQVNRSAYNGHEIANREGGNGIVWYVNVASRDPRLPLSIDSSRVDNVWTYKFSTPVRQRKFSNGTVMFKLADYAEKEMIEAEYLLNTQDPAWINAINRARQTVGLADTTAPIDREQQIDLLFRERAFWFYGNATRLSDMRRLVRQYNRDVNLVYPTGGYDRSEHDYSYGDATLFIPPTREFVENYNYSGCIHRDP